MNICDFSGYSRISKFLLMLVLQLSFRSMKNDHEETLSSSLASTILFFYAKKHLHITGVCTLQIQER